MDIRPLTEAYAVSPQIDPEDMAAIRAAGYQMVIDNRPDAEIPPSHHASVMQQAAEAAGLTFIINPVIGGMLTMANVEAQAKAMAAATGPVLAYCASGNRSSIVWALSQAGKLATDDLIAIPARHGYSLEGMRGQLDALASQKG
jgi:uncharacterized protein (TIGR01244 family)